MLTSSSPISFAIIRYLAVRPPAPGHAAKTISGLLGVATGAKSTGTNTVETTSEGTQTPQSGSSFRSDFCRSIFKRRSLPNQLRTISTGQEAARFGNPKRADRISQKREHLSDEISRSKMDGFAAEVFAEVGLDSDGQTLPGQAIKSKSRFKSTTPALPITPLFGSFNHSLLAAAKRRSQTDSNPSSDPNYATIEEVLNSDTGNTSIPAIGDTLQSENLSDDEIIVLLGAPPPTPDSGELDAAGAPAANLGAATPEPEYAKVIGTKASRARAKARPIDLFARSFASELARPERRPAPSIEPLHATIAVQTSQSPHASPDAGQTNRVIYETVDQERTIDSLYETMRTAAPIYETVGAQQSAQPHDETMEEEQPAEPVYQTIDEVRGDEHPF